MPTPTDTKPPEQQLVPQADLEPSIRDELKNYSIAELETLAVELHEKYWRAELCLRGHDVPNKDILERLQTAPSLDAILEERKWRLNRDFKFTPKTIARFLKVNKFLADSLTKGRHEARPVMLEMEKRLKNKDAFLTDYDLEIEIQPYFYKEGGIHEVLEGIFYKSCHLKRPKCILKAYYENKGKGNGGADRCNWNIHSGLPDDIFKKHHICYLMHELCDHTCWSYPDILQIKNVWAEVIVRRQHSADLK